MPTVRNARGADLFASREDEGQLIAIQSKALSKRSDVPLGTVLTDLRSQWWIITVNANSDQPTCFVLSLAEVISLAVRNVNKDGKVSFWLPARDFIQDEFREAWHRLDEG